MRTVVVLPEPLGPSKREDRADGDVEVEAVDRADVAEELGQPLRLDGDLPRGVVVCLEVHGSMSLQSL